MLMSHSKGAFMIDGGWSRFDGDQAAYQVETLIQTAYLVDQAWQNGTLHGAAD